MATAFGRIGELFVGERYEAARKRVVEVVSTLVHRPMGAIGLAIILFFVALAVLAPVLAGPYPSQFLGVNVGPPNLPPSSEFPLGTSPFGESNWALLAYGARVSLIVGFTASFVAMILGTLTGVASGYYGGFTDRSLSWITNFFLVIPWLPFVIVIATVIGPGFWTTVTVIAIVSWPTTARVVRSRVLSLKTLGYIVKARSIGAGDGYIMIRHILPVIGPLIFANMILTVSNSIFTESFLAFFGLGDPTQVSWGQMIDSSWDHFDVIRGAYWAFLPPGVCITALVLAFTMVSHVLEEVMNPRLRKR